MFCPTCTIATSAPRCPPRKTSYQFDRVLSGGEANAEWRHGSATNEVSRAKTVFAAYQRVQPFQGQRQVGATLVIGHGVDLIHDHRLDGTKILAAFLRGQQDVERFRRRHQDVRRMLEHGSPFGGQGIAGADRGANGWAPIAAFQGQLLNFPERLVQVFLHVIAECFQWGNVDHRGMGRQRAIDRSADKLDRCR